MQQIRNNYNIAAILFILVIFQSLQHKGEMLTSEISVLMTDFPLISPICNNYVYSEGREIIKLDFFSVRKQWYFYVIARKIC